MSDFEEFAELEQRLRKELRPVEPPAGFADRVMQRIEMKNRPAQEVPFRSSRVRWRGWVSGAVAASLGAGIFAGVRVREIRQVHRAQVAQQQFDTALRVTSETLEKTKEQLQRQLDGDKGERE